MRNLILALSLPLLTFASAASAHFNMTMPPTIAKSTEGGKGAPPCGPDTAATGPITAATGGHALKLNIDETVGHPGFYRFALSLDGPAKFPPDNAVYDKNKMLLSVTSSQNSSSADFESPPVFPVIADDMFAHTSAPTQSFPSDAVPGQVILPNVDCEKCTLQVIEFMANHGSNGAAGYFYHHCAYLKITADPSLPPFGAGGAGGGSGVAGGLSAGSGGSSAGGADGARSGGGGASGGAEPGAAGSATRPADESAGTGATTSGDPPSSPSVSGGPDTVETTPPGASGMDGAVSGEPAASDDGGCSVRARGASSRWGMGVGVMLGAAMLGRRRRRRSTPR